MADQVTKTTQKLTTAAQMREATVMLMQPNANWEQYLTPAPVSITIMAELVFISSADDFSINKNPPADGYKYIRYPESFRACLMQVCNSGWHAFNEAHVNMDQIRIYTATVPDHMKEAVNTLFNGSDAVIENVLPNQLQNIRVVADDCFALADGVKNKYLYVINLIQELLEACVNAKHFYGEELEKVKLRLKAAKMREQTSRLLNERSKKAMAAMEKQLDEAQADFKQSMDSIPSGWEMIGMDFVQGLASGATGLISLPFTLISMPVKMMALAMAPRTNQQGPGEKVKNVDDDVDVFAQINAFSKSEEILSLVGTLKHHMSGNEINWKNLYDQKKKCPKTNWTESQFKRIVNTVEKMPQGKACEKVLSICHKGLNICGELAKYSPDKKWNEATTEQLIKKITELSDEAFTFDSNSKKISGTPAFTPKPPMMYKQQSTSSGGSASQRVSENARFKIEQSREQLKQTREAYNKCLENMEKNEKELNEILIEMQSCDIKEIDFETTIKMLVKGLDAMGRVKEQWEKMVLFFQMVSNIVKISLSKTMHDFATTSEDTKKLAYNDKLFTKDLLYNQAFQASNIASLVHMISTTYTEVSNKYLMDRVSSLGKLMAMDKDRPEFHNEHQSLKKSCEDAQNGILHLVRKNKDEFKVKTNARMAKIEGELKAVLPAASPQETERIKEIVKGGFSKEEIDDYI